MRRRRFTGHKNSGEPVSILAYDYEGAREAFKRHFGYEPWNLTSGKPKVAATWEVNPTGLDRTLQELGINWPVNIRRTKSMQKSGSHILRRRNGVLQHFITADKALKPNQAVRVLLHELRHAWQAEQVASDSEAETLLAWRKHPGRRGSYYNRPIERDAREAEKRVNEFLDLTREA